MVATYTDDLRLTKQGDNDNPNDWGNIVNTQVIELLEEAVAGVVDVSITGSSNVTIAGTVNNGASDDARHAVIRLTGTLGADINFTVPDVEKVYVFEGAWTDTGGPWTVSIKTSGASTVDIVTGDTALLFTNGTTITQVSKFPIATPSTFTTGMIMLWSGLISAIPAGWVFCNGSNGTPDLMDKFIIGGRQDDTVVKTNVTGSLTQTGGSAGPATSDSQGAHSHTGTTGAHTLTVAELPSHSHTTIVGRTSASGTSGGTLAQRGNGSDRDITTSPEGATGGGGSHSHTISSDGAHTHSTSILNPYYALAYIMKT
jgi:hypothetical protein